MFDGVKMLCMGPKKDEPFSVKCLHPIIVPEDKFLKLANTQICCPSCGHLNSNTQPYFHSLIKLRKTVSDLMKTGIYIRYYELTIESSREHGNDDFTLHILERNDWSSWNLQIASITIAKLEAPSMKMELWEGHNFKARPYFSANQSANTFEKVLNQHSMSLGTDEIVITPVKTLIKEIRSYNKAWRNLVELDVTSCPVDLNHSLYTGLAYVNSLDELFSDDEKI